MTTTIDVRYYTHADAADIRQTLLDVHADAYADRADDSFVQRFPWFVDHWSSNPGFACVIGYDGSEPIGYAYGAAAMPEREWWRDHLDPAPEQSRTFHLSELMIRPKWRKAGHSERLHRSLLDARDDHLAVLLVDVTHPKVQELYESWGYRKVGERQPFPDSPLYAVMLRTLPNP
ncbi:ribosomal protein S18 acetylase RimI-like enzyme [Streptomyces eurocidicus]|uniref:Ribosomal protein S18 acetylase RimI-like enzyme n=1 Tax=Streptomyces eurocidicus TaxID=66423 RepID=A0A7W8B8C2_STREU|nr:ribosomal protein S18 acetylase RimI-like enzyme [Streptomyces eurocidicus]